MAERTMMSECYSCEHRMTIPWDCHTQCANPDPDMTGSEHGIKNGWFLYPLNFDPIWKTSDCKNYSPSVKHTVSDTVSDDKSPQHKSDATS